MIIGLLLIQGFSFLYSPVTLGLNAPHKPPLGRSVEPFRSNLETKFLLSDYGAVVKERQPNRWERLALDIKKSANFSE